MKPTHSLLRRQLRRHFAHPDSIPAGWQEFIRAIDDAYREFDDDRAMLERSLELSSNELLSANTDLRALFQAIPDAFLKLDGRGHVLEFKAGADPGPWPVTEDPTGRHVRDCFPADVAGRIENAIAAAAGARDKLTLEYAISGTAPSTHLELRLVPLPGETWIAIVRDISDRKRVEEQLRHGAFHDTLTGLPNRALFLDRLGHALDRIGRRADYRFCVIFLDLDRFKVLNDSLGHLVGDQLLIEVARRLESQLRPGDTVARLGGDEFCILLEDIADTAEAVQVAERIQQSVSVPVTIADSQVFTSVSIGIAFGNSAYVRPEQILRDADIAMYQAKAGGKARHAIFDADMHDDAMRLLALETDMRRAVDRREFELHYQPIISLRDDRLVGFEALIRWRHPSRGLVPPADFIPLAEETGMIVPIGSWVLQTACRDAVRWQRDHPRLRPLTVSVNVSPIQLTQSNLVNVVGHAIADSGIEPGLLKLELTESAIMRNPRMVSDVLNRLTQDGVELYIDDFGTGYSSLSHLHHFPVDSLKIDRSFVRSLAPGGDNVTIARTIVSMARNLDLSVIAEGVENTTQLSMLAEMGCDQAQGYLFSRPLADAELKRYLDRRCDTSRGAPRSDPGQAMAGRRP